VEARPPETPSERRRRQQRAGARRAILDATEALLVEDGFEAFSMRRLVERCGYSAPTIYHHFGDKQGLIDHLIDERVRRLLARLRRVPRTCDPEQTLRACCEAFVRFGLLNPTHYRLLSAPRPDDSPEPESAAALRAFFEAPLLELEQSGRLRAADLEEAKQVLWVLLHGVISMRNSRPDYPWSRTLLRTALDAMLRGLLSEGGACAAVGAGRLGSAS
jgi:AcrR family transcriptional regulator